MVLQKIDPRGNDVMEKKVLPELEKFNFSSYNKHWINSDLLEFFQSKPEDYECTEEEYWRRMEEAIKECPDKYLCQIVDHYEESVSSEIKRYIDEYALEKAYEVDFFKGIKEPNPENTGLNKMFTRFVLGYNDSSKETLEKMLNNQELTTFEKIQSSIGSKLYLLHFDTPSHLSPYNCLVKKEEIKASCLEPDWKEHPEKIKILEDFSYEQSGTMVVLTKGDYFSLNPIGDKKDRWYIAGIEKENNTMQRKLSACSKMLEKAENSVMKDGNSLEYLHNKAKRETQKRD